VTSSTRHHITVLTKLGLTARAVPLLRIEPDGLLHALTLTPNRPEYFVRRDATTYYARPEELTALLQTVAASSAPWAARA
jgi:hypothetical protein